jgi:hypothetical protein
VVRRGIGHHLRRRRLLVLLGGVVALAVGFGVATGRLAAAPVKPGSATLQTLLRPRGGSPLDLDPGVVGGLPARAQLIGDLMAAAPTRTQIERRAGLAPGALTVVTPNASKIEDPVPLAVQAITASAPKTADVLTVKADGDSPIITLNAQGLTRAAAVRTVKEAAAGLDRLLAGPGPQGSGLVVARLGDVAARGPRRPSRLPTAVMAALAVLGLWCAALVAGAGLRPGGADPGPGRGAEAGSAHAA